MGLRRRELRLESTLGRLGLALGLGGPATLGRSDTFNRANSGTPGTPSDGGPAWVVLGGVWTIASNRLVPTTLSANNFCSLEARMSDVAFQVTLPTVGNDDGIALRVSDNLNSILVAIRPTNVTTFRYQAGAANSLNVANVTTNAGDVYKVVAKGSLITIYQNGVSIAAVTETFNQTVTKHGFRSFDTNNCSYDNLTIRAA